MAKQGFLNYDESPVDDRIAPLQPMEIDTNEVRKPNYHPCLYILVIVVVILLIFPVVTIPILFTVQSSKVMWGAFLHCIALVDSAFIYHSKLTNIFDY